MHVLRIALHNLLIVHFNASFDVHICSVFFAGSWTTAVIEPRFLHTIFYFHLKLENGKYIANDFKTNKFAHPRSVHISSSISFYSKSMKIVIGRNAWTKVSRFKRQSARGWDILKYPQCLFGFQKCVFSVNTIKSVNGRIEYSLYFHTLWLKSSKWLSFFFSIFFEDLKYRINQLLNSSNRVNESSMQNFDCETEIYCCLQIAIVEMTIFSMHRAVRSLALYEISISLSERCSEWRTHGFHALPKLWIALEVWLNFSPIIRVHTNNEFASQIVLRRHSG